MLLRQKNLELEIRQWEDNVFSKSYFNSAQRLSKYLEEYLFVLMHYLYSLKVNTL